MHSVPFELSRLFILEVLLSFLSHVFRFVTFSFQKLQLLFIRNGVKRFHKFVYLICTYLHRSTLHLFSGFLLIFLSNIMLLSAMLTYKPKLYLYLHTFLPNETNKEYHVGNNKDVSEKHMALMFTYARTRFAGMWWKAH